MSIARAAAIAILCGALGSPAPVRSQGGFGVPIVPGDLAGPLILLLIPLALSFSNADNSRLHVLEAQGDWMGVAELASRRLADHPDDARWLEVRGRARQRLGQYPQALADLRLAFDGRSEGRDARADAAFAAGLSLGLCEMALGDWNAALRTMDRLSVLVPLRWEPGYNRGVILARQGDFAGAEAAAAALKSRQPTMAASLQRDVAAMRASAVAAEASAAAAALGGSEEGLAEHRLTIGGRELRLPRGHWIVADTSARTVQASRGRAAMLTGPEQVAVTTQQAYALSSTGRVVAAVSFSANVTPTSGASLWNVDDPCKVQAALHVQRFRSGFDRPECLSVRVVDAASPDAMPSLFATLLAARSSTARLPQAGYEVQYTRYSDDRMVAVTWWLPLERSAGDLATIEWAHALAANTRALAGATRTAAASVPPMGPMP